MACPVENDLVIRSLQLLDPTLQFLTKATGQTTVAISTLHSTIPSTRGIPFSHLQKLVEYGILQVVPPKRNKEKEQVFENQWNQKQEEENVTDFRIGFPSPDDNQKRLSGSTKTAAKRRMAELRRKLKSASSVDGNDQQRKESENEDAILNEDAIIEDSGGKDWTLPTEMGSSCMQEPILEMEVQARQALDKLLGLKPAEAKGIPNQESTIPTHIIPKQASYAGSNPAQGADYLMDAEECDWTKKLHPTLLSSLLGKRQLYSHQDTAIRSALQNKPTLVCTGTGSGKSLCFLVPVLQAALEGRRSLLLFPTKALAQDQIVKLQSLLMENGLGEDIRIATLDGDTPHSHRASICKEAHLILTNPDTLHAAILPQWKHLYKPIFLSLKYVVIDEAHMYEGVFGAHVAMILARLYRIASLHSEEKSEVLVFLAYSATLAHPEHHFRLLCCIPQKQHVEIVTKDGSPRAAKHFWVWNPPLLDVNGKSMETVVLPNSKEKKQKGNISIQQKSGEGPVDFTSRKEESRPNVAPHTGFISRRHSADETALLLARAVTKGVRCIAFCKTRGLVEWVYERTLAALRQSPVTAKFTSKVESYRGGYTKMERRMIEQKLFQNELLGVVGTSALELGVDIGGVDLTLHCGFPSSHASLMQQAGRAGRGAASRDRPSLAICVCFNSPLDQHLWRHPSSLLTRGLTAPLSMPIYPGLVQGHLLCAGLEFPLVGPLNVRAIQSTVDAAACEKGLLCDYDLFGSQIVYQEALDVLQTRSSLTEETVAVKSKKGEATIYKTHPSLKNPWTGVSIRSIESVNYEIVDVSHPMQGGRMDKVCNEAAVLDTVPYSRVFYHAFPGAIIMHRGRRYKIVSMTRPPAFGNGFHGTLKLGAFAKPSTHRYFTRPLSTLKITVVKQMERVDLKESATTVATDSLLEKPSKVDVSQVYDAPDPASTSFAGCGVVTVKRNVHGYKKLSLVTRAEISRSELSLPDMEFDTFAFWLDCDANVLGPVFRGDDFGYGVHALSHAILAVAPLFVPCVASDVQCDHSIYNPTKVCVFDARAGGSGICAQLWKSVFVEDGLIEAAINLLESCPSCSNDRGYSGGCPACLQAGECIKFNDFLCRSSGLIIARHLLKRLKKAEVYVHSEKKCSAVDSVVEANKLPRLDRNHDVTSPRRKARERAMRSAKDISKANHRQVVVGRPCWPMDRSDGPKHESHDD
eukprot:scaffold22641_cov206-Cylindrotheca_fusiformis.AAC.14